MQKIKRRKAAQTQIKRGKRTKEVTGKKLRIIILLSSFPFRFLYFRSHQILPYTIQSNNLNQTALNHALSILSAPSFLLFSFCFFIFLILSNKKTDLYVRNNVKLKSIKIELDSLIIFSNTHTVTSRER